MKDIGLYIEDMIERAERIAAFTENDREIFLGSILIQDAVLRNFQVVGEAAKHIPEDFRRRYAEIPWKEITGFRDVIVHDYDDLILLEVWKTIELDLLPLLPRLREILRELDENSAE